MEHQMRPISNFNVPSNKDGDCVDIEIHVSRLRSENLDLATWGSSSILANQLHLLDIRPNDVGQDEIQMLELGAGTGLVGLSAAVIWKANIVLTDLRPLIPGLAKNIEENARTLADHGAAARAGTLDWNNPTTLTFYGDDGNGKPRILSAETAKASIIFAADTIYSEDHPEMLCNAIFAWLKHGPQSRVIIAYPLRVVYLDAIRELWERLEAGGLVSIEEGKAETGDEWDDEKLHEWSVWKWRENGDKALK
jgi:predicted nicotinamide N-methyase